MEQQPMNPMSDPESGDSNASEREALRLEKDRQSWAMLCHLSSFACTIVPLGNIFGPLTVYLVKRHEYDIVEDQGREAVNFQISVTIYGIILLIGTAVAGIMGGLLSGTERDAVAAFLIAVGFLALFFFLGVFTVIFTIVASVKSYRGERYRYPASIRFLREAQNR